jgi:nucleotide-binding universal stress UspA family protein
LLRGGVSRIEKREAEAAMKLLVCLDGSDMSLGALEPAAKMAAAANADVHLLRVLDVSDVRERTRGKMVASRRSTGDWSGGSLPGAGGGFWSAKAREQAMMIEDRGQALSRAESDASDALRAAASSLGDDVTYRIMVGADPAAAITSYAKECGADFIVMATHSRKGLGRMLFGSTTSKVVEAGVAPVIVVHPSEP